MKPIQTTNIGLNHLSKNRRNSPARWLVASLLAFGLSQQAAYAEPAPIPSNTPHGLFGFMDDSTVIAQGVFNPVYTFLPSWSTGTQTWNQKLTFNYGVTDRFEAGLAISYAPTIDTGNIGNSRLINLSLPLQYVFVQRMQNGTGFAILSTPTIGWEDFNNQASNRQWSFDNHFVLDHDFDGRFFAGINIGYTASNTYARSGRTPGGTLYLQGGGTVKITPHFYWGIQAQISQQLNDFVSDPSGWAAFLGTSVSVPLTSTATLSAAYMRQLVGRENDTPSARLNTQSFSQNMAKAMLSLYF